MLLVRGWKTKRKDTVEGGLEKESEVMYKKKIKIVCSTPEEMDLLLFALFKGCFRCTGNHIARSCPVYPERCEAACVKCIKVGLRLFHQDTKCQSHKPRENYHPRKAGVFQATLDIDTDNNGAADKKESVGLCEEEEGSDETFGCCDLENKKAETLVQMNLNKKEKEEEVENKPLKVDLTTVDARCKNDAKYSRDCGWPRRP